MNVVNVFGPSHRNDGAPGYLLNVWDRIPNVTAIHKTILDDPKDWGPFGFCVEVDWAKDCFSYPDIRLPSPSVCWQSDTHWTPAAYAYRLEQARKFDVVFCMQKKAVEDFGRDGVKATWLPHAVEHTCYTPILKDYDLAKRINLPPEPAAFKDLVVERYPRYDWCFVGHMNTPRRLSLLSRLCDGHPNFGLFYAVFFEEAAKVYGSSRVCVNVSVNGDLNMRCFEVCATGGFLLTDRQDGMTECGFVDGETCAIYDTEDECEEKLDYYLAHEDERKRIAEAGYRLVLGRHTYLHRAQVILDTMTKRGIV